MTDLSPSYSERGGARSSNFSPRSTNPPPALEDGPTDSHALAVADHDEKGAAQVGHEEPEVKDLGWHEETEESLVGGLPNEELWTLVRRFDKQMYHVKAIPVAPLGGLDLNIADEDEFSPEKLRSNIERLYMTVVIGSMGFVKHIVRLRSWKEPRRTAAFCAAYYVAWLLDFIVPSFVSMLLLLIVYPPARTLLFPPAPLALVDNKTGGVKKPSAGVLGSHNSLTGAPEKHQGEAVEQEAHNFVSGLGAIGLSAATGKHTENKKQEEEGAIDTSIPDPTAIATRAADSKDVAAGGAPNAQHDKTKQPMEAAMWQKARPVMHVIADIADGWERFANALSPTPPFPQDLARLRLAGVLVPVLGVGILTSSYAFVKITTFISGAGFFGDPLLIRGIDLLNRTVPDWQKYLEIRNTILKGVPTNAQLTLTLLRIGEANKAPLPPPPTSSQPPSTQPRALETSDVPLDASHSEIQSAIHHDPSQPAPHAELPAKPKKQHGRHIVSFFKRSTKFGVSTVLGTDNLKAAAGSEHARHRLGVLPRPNPPPSGPVSFKGRYNGKKGRIYLSTAATIPCLSFAPDTPTGKDPVTLDAGDQPPIKPLFSIAVADIAELKKIGGFGWKAKLIVGWAMDREVADGLEVIDHEGTITSLTAIPLREELFNRLIAMGGQVWESW
ncbi:MAG: hypothetical protein M1833_002173 [Piccolia ochrophora]|nr:MAG: hypothetical protein M1833_002173 [Piccolia ochrophora]